MEQTDGQTDARQTVITLVSPDCYITLLLLDASSVITKRLTISTQ